MIAFNLYALSFFLLYANWRITGLTWEDVIIDEESIATNNAKVIINKELSRVNAEAMQKLKEKDILKIFPTQKPHCTTRLVLKNAKNRNK